VAIQVEYSERVDYVTFKHCAGCADNADQRQSRIFRPSNGFDRPTVPLNLILLCNDATGSGVPRSPAHDG
jgi:hypothetical protein